MVTTITLGDVPCTTDRTIHWRLKQGVMPYQDLFTLAKTDADALFAATATAAGPKPVALSVTTNGSNSLYQKLYLIQQTPSRAPYLVDVAVADIRWLWKRRHIVRRYNIRRATGGKVATYDPSSGQLALNTVGLPDDIAYAAFSLNPATKKAWTALEVVADVLNDVTGGAFDGKLPAKVDPKELPVEGVELDDAGDEAVTRVLQLVPELACWIDADGIARLTLRNSGEEYDLLRDSGSPVIGPSLAVNVELDRVRPSRIEVYFTCEDELRFDYVEPATTPTTADATDPPPDPLVMTNVMPLPDPSVKVGGANAQMFYQGMWVPINQDLFDAWNNDATHPATLPGSGAVLPPLSFDFIQNTLWTSPGGYNSYWEAGVSNNDVTWPRRWSALQNHYRQTYQISHKWLSRIKALYGVRAQLLDATTGTRQTAQVWQNYSQIPNARRLWRAGSDLTTKIGWLTNSFNADASGKLPALATTAPAPSAVVQVVDSEQGVIRVVWRTDAYGDFVDTIPTAIQSRFLAGALPSTNPADQVAGTAGFLLGVTGATPKHAASVVLTAVPAAPQGLAQLFRVDVTPADAKRALPSSVQQRIGACNGPPWQLRVGAAVLPARFVWDDGAPGNPGLVYYKSVPRLASTCINLDQVSALARAVAASIYGFLADRIEGSRVAVYNPSAEPRGRVESVEHIFTSTGGTFTTLAMPTDTAPTTDPFALLPESVRRMILGLVKPPGAVRAG